MPGPRRSLPEPTLARLPVYQRIAVEFDRRDRGVILDSTTLGRLAGVAPATVRRDLSYLGALGTRGAGYDPATLVSQIDEVLGRSTVLDVAVIGMGNLGRALVNSSNFLGGVASLTALYDSDPSVIGTSIAGVPVTDIAAGIAPVPMAVICTPPEVAQEVADQLVAAGTHAILNFAPIVITVPLGVAVRYVDFSIELQILAYQLMNGTGPLGGGVLHTLGITPPVRRPGS